MSLDRIFKALLKLELSKTDARVYIYLATKGPAKASMISYDLKMNKQQLYRSLKNLRIKNIIKSNLKYPSIFSAVPLEKALKILIKTKKEKAEEMKEKKADLLHIWKSLTKEGV